MFDAAVKKIFDVVNSSHFRQILNAGCQISKKRKPDFGSRVSVFASIWLFCQSKPAQLVPVYSDKTAKCLPHNQTFCFLKSDDLVKT